MRLSPVLVLPALASAFLAACVPARDRPATPQATSPRVTALSYAPPPLEVGTVHVGAPVHRRIGVGAVAVEPGDPLVPATIQRQPVRCTERLAYGHPLFGPYSRACFADRDRDGAFDTLLVGVGPLPFSYDLTPPVAYAPG